MQRLETVAIVGVGLIGGSIGLALRAGGLAARVVGVGRDLQTLQQAQDRGVIDEATTDLEAGVADAEVVVVCTPVSRIPHDVRRAARAVPAGALVTDAGSTKRQIVESIESHPDGAEIFVGRIRSRVPNAREPHMPARASCTIASACSPRQPGRLPPACGAPATSGEHWDAVSLR